METIYSQFSFFCTNRHIKTNSQPTNRKPRLPNKPTEPSKGIGAKTWSVNLVAVTHEELLGEIVQVCEGQLARVIALAYAQVDNSVVNDVARWNDDISDSDKVHWMSISSFFHLRIIGTPGVIF